MFEWTLENLIKTCYYLACFFTAVGITKFIIFAIKMWQLKRKNIQTERSFLFDEVYTFQSIAAFFAGFGWIGHYLLTHPQGQSVTYCMISAIIAGIICLQISVKIMFSMKKNLFKDQPQQENTEEIKEKVEQTQE